MVRVYIRFTILLLTLFISFQGFSQDNSIGRGCFGGTQVCEEGIGKSARVSEKVNLSKNSDNQLILQLSINKLSFQEKKNITGGLYTSDKKNIEEYQFIQEEDLVIPDDILESLGLNYEKNLIKSGAYPMTVQNNKAIVVLTLY